MKKLLLRTLLLAVPFGLFLVCFEVGFARQNPSHYSAKKHLLERHASQIEVLVLGPSHAFTGVDPQIMERPTFNLAANSQSIYYDAALARKYLPALPALKIVVVPVSYMSLEYELDESPERWRCYYYRYFFSLPHRDWHMACSARNFSAWFLCGSEISRTSVLFGTAGDATREYDDWGGWTNRPCGALLPSMVDPEFLSRSAATVLKRHAASMHPRNLSANIARLESLIGDLRQRKVEVLLVTLPVTRFYREGMEPETYRRMQDALGQLSGRAGVRYHNYTDDPGFVDADFADGDHLNCRGAEKFSRLLDADVKVAMRPAPKTMSGGGND